MTAARYWRVSGIDTWGGGGLSLSALQLYDSTGRVDTSATLSTPIPPVTGLLANLQDGDLSTYATWARSAYVVAGFYLQWDFGSGVSKDITDVQIGSATSRESFIERYLLESSPDGVVWSSSTSPRGVSYNGPNLLHAITLGTATYTESFNADGTSKFVNVLNSASIAWDSNRPAMFFSGGGYQNLIAMSGAPLLAAEGWWCEADIEFVSDSLGRKHFGFFMSDNNSNSGIRLVSLDNYMAASTFTNGTENQPGTNSSDDSSVVVGGTYTFKAVLSYGTISLYINGVLRVSLSGITYTNLRPGFFVYGNTIAVHAVRSGTLLGLELPPYRFGLKGVSLPLVQVGSPNVTYHLANEAMFLEDIAHGGVGIISGQVTVTGVPDAPVVRRVRLHRKIDGMMTRETWSATDGSYSFPNIAVQPYYVTSFDHTGNYNGVIKDSIVPEVMP